MAKKEVGTVGQEITLQQEFILSHPSQLPGNGCVGEHTAVLKAAGRADTGNYRTVNKKQAGYQRVRNEGPLYERKQRSQNASLMASAVELFCNLNNQIKKVREINRR